jgi:hypothetical protein
LSQVRQAASSLSDLVLDFNDGILLRAPTAHKKFILSDITQSLPGCGCALTPFLAQIGPFSSF